MTNDMYCKDDLLTDSVFLKEVGVVSVIYPCVQVEDFPSPWETHRKKSFSIFPSPAGMSLTKLSLGGNCDVIYKFFLPREILLSDILAVDGNIVKFFFTVQGPVADEISRTS